jgi:hypothetical protein
VTAVEAVVAAISLLLLAWIGFALFFLRHRLSRGRKLAPAGLAVGPLIYGSVTAALLMRGGEVGLLWALLAVFAGAALATLRSHGTALLSGPEGKGWSVSTSPFGLLPIAVIASVQPALLAARRLSGGGLDEAGVHLWVALFLLSLSGGYAAAMAVRVATAAGRRRLDPETGSSR